MGYYAKIILDSIGPNGARLTTFELSYPRFVHAELMTHRLLSRNSASSRAIPPGKLQQQVVDDTVYPVVWGKNQSGMQAREELHGEALAAAKSWWTIARDRTVGYARELSAVGLHKQLANRPIEPWMFITVVVTATEWGNFWGLRDHPDAQPELAHVAHLAHELYRKNEPMRLPQYGLHLPYVTGYDGPDATRLPLLTGGSRRALAYQSIGRCAAVSYLKQDQHDPDADEARAEKMLAAGHMSPFEHVARAMTEEEWNEHATEAARRWIYERVPVGNFWGWAQWRKSIDDEHDFSLQAAHG